MADIQQPLTFTPLSTLLQTVHQGRSKIVLEAVDDSLADVVHALQRLGGSGKVVLTLGLSMEKGRVEISATVTQKKPETGSVPSLFFIDKAGRLVEDDPEQIPLPLVERMGRTES